MSSGLLLDPAVSFDERGPDSRVCVISCEVVGPSRNGGIGTANTSLALALARDGVDVTLLFTAVPREASEHAHWETWFGQRGVRYEQLDPLAIDGIANAFVNVRHGWATFEHVRDLHEERPFSVIHGPEFQGHLVFIALAKAHGVAFADAEIVCGTHSPTPWTYEANRTPMGSLAAHSTEFLERAAVRNADVLISPSAYMLGYLRDRGWTMPSRAFVQPYLESQAVRELRRDAAPGPRQPGPADELVFFGRLETRKGLEPFCDALDRLARKGGAVPRRVTFLGSSAEIAGEPSEAYVRDRARTWPWPWELLTSYSQPEAIAYLHGGRRVAVVASLVDNSPNTVYEALALEIPLIVCGDGGTHELLAPKDRARHAFSYLPPGCPPGPRAPGEKPTEPDIDSLTAALLEALELPLSVPRFAVDPEDNEQAHVAWNAGRRTAVPAPAASASLSFLLHDPDPADVIALAEWGDGVIAANPDATEGLPEGWRAVEPTASLETFNRALAATKGEMIVLLPPHVGPLRALGPVLANAAARSGAELFTFVARHDGQPGRKRVDVPAGGPAILGLSHRVEGENGFAVRRSVLIEHGGLSCSADPFSDLLTRCSLAGRQIEPLPAVLTERGAPSTAADLGDAEHWPEGAPWPEDGPRTLARLRPFLRAPQTDLALLPPLYRSLQEVVARVHRDARKHGRDAAEYAEAQYARAERLQQHAEDMDAHTADLHGHIERVEAHAETIRADAHRVQAHAEEQEARFAHAELRAAEHERERTAEMERLRSELDRLDAEARARVLSRVGRRVRRLLGRGGSG